MEVFNTLGRTRQEFTPVADGRVGMYVCGPTVQGAPHVGHGRSAVAFDVIVRYLEWVGYEVHLVMNITDVEDKIIAAAGDRGVPPEEVAAEAAEQFLAAYRKLGVREPTVLSKATEHIPDMISHIEGLIDHGVAYRANGDVYFSVRAHPGYGKLSGRDLDDLLAGARVEPGEQKRDPLDFALWKAAKPGEPSWESPWGPGRPGWHIECSVMAEKYLGFGFDIHGGGADLIFPHHENEIAQSEAAHGSGDFARFWMHNGLVNLSGDKMAKSTGHVVDLLEAIDAYGAQTLRLFYLRKRYRDPLDFSEASIHDAAAQLERLWAFRRRWDGATAEPDEPSLARFRAAMDDDFNTAEALAGLFELVREGNKSFDDDDEDPAPLVAAYDQIVEVLGLAEPARPARFTDELLDLASHYGLAVDDADRVVEGLLERREAARKEGHWSVADDIRDRLAAAGVTVEDTPDGPRWHW